MSAVQVRTPALTSYANALPRREEDYEFPLRPSRSAATSASSSLILATSLSIAGAIFREVARDIFYGVVLAWILIVFAAIFAALAHYWLGLRIDALVLSYAPGGFAEMSLVGLALGVEVSMVATHHLSRVFMIILGAPFVFRLGLLRRKG